MSAAETPKADRLRVQLGPLRRDNPLAALALWRIETAADPEAEAERVIAEITATFRDVVALIEPFKPLARALIDVAGTN